jgi:mannose-1-phosphate guanylyltransferase
VAVVTVALVLAGGFGKRLRPYTLEVPKILLPLGSKTIAEYLIDWLRYYGVNEIFMLVGYLKEKIIEALGSGARYGVYVSYIVEDEPLGTGGALRNASHIIGRMEKVIAVNGDIITNLDPKKLLQTLEDNIVASIASVPLRSPYGILDIEGGRVKGFREKPTLRDYWVNAGVYALKKDIIEYLPEKGDIERSTFPLLASRGQLAVVRYETPPYYWRSIDSPKDLEDIPRELEEIGGLLASLESI